MSGFTQVDYWLAETVSDPFVVRRLLMGGSLTSIRFHYCRPLRWWENKLYRHTVGS
ncbi:hypothetical protein BDB13_5106 [Rhodococcus sp. OK302]|nr:hypothetical protein BDB13_5106 [Rhodococcus sp. OK302]